jgi:hypothetical protein
MAWLLRHPTLVLLVSLLLLGGGALGLFGWIVIRPVRVRVPDRLPDGFPAAGFDHASFAALLERFVDGQGEVDYAAWKADAQASEQLDRYLAAAARYSPDSHPDRFPTPADRQAYWLYAYNACVIKGVLLHWPLQSVRDVKPPVDVVSGLGFFAKLWFTLGGEAMSLYRLENGVVRVRFPDPRSHFVLNCASAGCPTLRPELPTGAELEPFLARSAADFVADPVHVEVDHERRVVRLSQIFEWYASDFTSELARRGLPPSRQTLAVYVASVAEGARREELERAADYALEFRPYDWGLNARGD